MVQGRQTDALGALQSILVSPQIEQRIEQLEEVVRRLTTRLDEGKPFEDNVLAAVEPQIQRIENERLSRNELARVLIEIARRLE